MTDIGEQYLPGAISLLDQLDKQILVVLRDGKTLVGILRTLDQFANLLLENCIERIHVENYYGEIPRGIYLVRGENVVLAGEVDTEFILDSKLTKVSIEEILEKQQIELNTLKTQHDKRRRLLAKKGLFVEKVKEDQY